MLWVLFALSPERVAYVYVAFKEKLSQSCVLLSLRPAIFLLFTIANYRG